jgi:MFS superfamily sulfate permease-like transporter
VEPGLTSGKNGGTSHAVVPGLRAIATYRLGWLPSDVVAGLVLTTLLVPQGMAYAELAGLPAITGLYTSILCLIGYAIFGPSRILVLGPDSSLGPMIAAVNLFQLQDHGVSVVGGLPQGFPPLTVPSVKVSDLYLLVGGAFGIALVSLADTIATASACAARTGAHIDGNQEMLAIGAANIASGFFQGFPVSTSGSRTAVAEQAGGKTQVTGLVGALTIAVMLLFFPGLLRDLPQPMLAAVVISASLSLADIPGVIRLWHQRRTEFILSITAFLGVALLGVLPGIVVAVGLSVANVFRRSWWPYQAILGRVEGMPGYHDVRNHPDAEILPGLVVFRFDAPLFFANARTFRDQIVRLAAADPPPAWILIAAEPITDVDTTAADMLEDLDEMLNARGISLVFAEMKDPVRLKVDRYELTRTIDPAHFFPTLHAAVTAYSDESGATWTHPEETPI